ncbi:MAG TPA: hypothetical protein VLG45_02950 [Thermodesulfobacteriota bacterium]|nr:hypothetical protein [Thermodesulfobacteriota bacterium]
MGHVSKSGLHLIVPVLISLFVVFLYPVPAPADDDRDEDWGEDWDDDRDEDYDDYDEDYYDQYPTAVPYGYVVIPPGHLPPPGECRIWVPGLPPGHQPPPFDCSYFVPNAPAGGWLLYRPPY